MSEKQYISRARHEQIIRAYKDRAMRAESHPERQQKKIDSLKVQAAQANTARSELTKRVVELEAHVALLESKVAKVPIACPECGQSPLVPDLTNMSDMFKR